MTKVFVAGTFDNFHIGHQYLFYQASQLGDEIVVVIARDMNVKKTKGALPKNSEIRRQQRIIKENIPCSRVILGNEGNDFFNIVRIENPEIIALGYDQKLDEENFRENFPYVKVVRIKPYHPNFFKSSFF